MLYKKHNVSIVYVFSYQNYLTFSMCPIKVGVEVAQVGLILPFCCGFWQGVAIRICFQGNLKVERGSCRKRLPSKKSLFNHLLQEKHFVFVLLLNSSDSCGNCRCYHACYRLLEEEVHDLRVSYYFLKISNCFKELIRIYEPRKVVKTRGSGCHYSCFFLRNAIKRRIYRLSSNYVVDKFLQNKIDARSLFIAYVALKLVDGMSKTLGFW